MEKRSILIGVFSILFVLLFLVNLGTGFSLAFGGQVGIIELIFLGVFVLVTLGLIISIMYGQTGQSNKMSTIALIVFIILVFVVPRELISNLVGHSAWIQIALFIVVSALVGWLIGKIKLN
jgi:hypothetical protein